MVGVSIQCRLGNQLFQYAFIKALSEELNTPFFINEKTEKFIAANYFDLKGHNHYMNFIKWLAYKIHNGNLFRSLQSVAIDEYSPTTTACRNNNIYSGYFQSELFFKKIACKVSSYMKIKVKHKKRFNEKYEDTFSRNPIIAVHIRRGDYLNLNGWWSVNLGSEDLTLPINYYLYCLKQLEAHEDHRIIFVSDDIEFTRQQFAHIKNAEFSDNEMIIDFQILMNADICILSNSSFAWWAAYLNQKKSKKIFCPEYWLGFKIKKEYPANIIPDDWFQVTI